MRSGVGRWIWVAALLAGLAPGAARADMIVLASTAPSIAAGTVIQAGEYLTVPKGSSVTLLAADGTQQTIGGPGATVGGKPPAPSEAGVLGTLAALLDGEAGEARLGAARGLMAVDCAKAAKPESPAAIAELAKAGCVNEARQALAGLAPR